MLTHAAQIESILFTRTEGVTFSFLASLLSISLSEVQQAVSDLGRQLEGRGIRLLVSGETVLLTTHESMSDILAPLYDDVEVGELSPAALQTLSIILYKNGATKSEISYIRGVDSRMILRTLMIRGIIEKVPGDIYKATTDSLRLLGVASTEELPRYQEVSERLKQELEDTKTSQNGK